MANKQQNESLFVIIDGIDGSGKNTIARAMLDELAESGKQVFDLVAWSRDHGRLPTVEECSDADVFFTTEPSHVWIGSAIRQELIREGTSYSHRTIAEAFALDRLMLYRRLIIPLRARGKIIIQERGVPSSIVYQADQEGGYSLRELIALPGNALALEHAPDHLVIADCEPASAIARLAARAEKQDQAIFEKLSILEQFHARYHASWFQELWSSRNTPLHYLPATRPIDEVRALARIFIQPLISRRIATP